MFILFLLTVGTMIYCAFIGYPSDGWSILLCSVPAVFLLKEAIFYVWGKED